MKTNLLVCILLCMLVFLPFAAYAEDASPFDGSGTKGDPYLISSFDDLCMLSSLVNSGNEFENKYFAQTQNIDMGNIPFIPIGLFDGSSYFSGVYNGNGHYLENINIEDGGSNGLFGALGGTVMNLGIESGRIIGAYSGGITSHSSKSTAIIINCYNKASVSGHRAGGIADNFNGTIVNCWSYCDLSASDVSSSGAIYSYSSLIARNNYSSIVEDKNACPQKDCTFISYSEQTAQQIVDALNSRLYDSAVVSGVPASSLKVWSLDSNGNISLTKNSYTITLQDIPVIIRANLIYIFPSTFATIGLVLICLSFLGSQKKYKRNVLPEYKY